MACTWWFQLILTSFGRYVIPTRHFPLKSLSRNLKIGFPLSPPPNHALLPLTHDLMVSYIGWVQAGDVWTLRVPHFYVCPKSTCCSCIHRDLEARLHSLLSILDFLWHELFSDFSFFYDFLALGARLYLMVGFCLLSACSFTAIISCHSYCDVIWPNPAGPLWSCRLFFPQWLIMAIGFFYYITCRLQCPICFLLGILGSFAFPELPWPFSQLCILMGFY